MRGNKKGQFYLLAAIVIVSIIIGLAAVTNMVQKSGTIRLGDTGEELGIESEKVLEYGAVQTSDTQNLIDHFTNSYDEYAGEDKDIYFIIGDGRDLGEMDIHDCFCSDEKNEVDCKNSLQAYSYSELSTGTISYQIGAESTTLKINEKIKDTVPVCKIGDDEINISVGSTEYTFEIKPGENFYFVLQQDYGGEDYVVTG